MKTNMLMIIVLVVTAKLTLISGDCELGTLKLKDFNWAKLSGSWYVLFYSSDYVENDLDCFTVIIERPEGNISFLTIQAYVNSEQRHITSYGNATNWNSTGYVELHYLVPSWTGPAHYIAVDYDRYVIMKHCSLELNKMSVFVEFRSKHPDETTVKDALKDLKHNNIDISQFVMSTTDHCQQEESSTTGRISA